MAEPVVEALGNAVSDLLEGVFRRARPRAHAALDWLRTTAIPPPHVVLQAADGTLYTGFVIIERNRPVLMLAIRHETSRQLEPIVTPPPVTFPHRPSWDDSSPPREGDDLPFWRRR